MKKLMLLGGMRYLLPVIRAAHEEGIYVITCDYLPDNVAHKYSDEYVNVSIIDKDAVLKVAREHEIDGIMSFACDPGVVTAAYVAEKMGLPHTGSYEAISILQNKGRFREFLAQNGFKVPTAKGYHKAEDALKDVNLFHWPVIVKPTDSAGSKGVKRVDEPADLQAAIEYALSFSHSEEFIVEDFLEKVGCSSDTDSFSVDGELKFVSFSAQRFDEACENPYTPSAYSWPATISEEHIRELTGEIQRLLKLLGMRTGIYNIETRECTDGNAYIMECSPRGGGNRLAEMLGYATGVNLVKASVLAAMGEPVQVEQKPYDGFWAEVILHSEKPGVFRELWISDQVGQNLIERDLWIESGEKVGGFSGANEAIGTLVFRFDSRDEQEEFIRNQNRFVKVMLQEG